MVVVLTAPPPLMQVVLLYEHIPLLWLKCFSNFLYICKKNSSKTIILGSNSRETQD